MKVAKGTPCVSTCCGRRYRAQFDFEPKLPHLLSDGVVYLRGECFLCKLRTKIGPELAKHGIILGDPS